jgi:putative nucleotidyltransferase-like protein
VDARTADVVCELRARGVRPILLKGPAIASWLDGENSHRVYVDTDLLVAPSQLSMAERYLSEAGFTKTLEDADTPGGRPPGHFWVRGADGTAVDLHRTLLGVGVAPAKLWQVLSESTELMRVAGVDVEVLSTEARALHLALHAAQHGPAVRKPLDDLERALLVLDFGTWAAAASLAERLDATGAFAMGLSFQPRGKRLVADLPLPRQRPVEVALCALRLEQVASAPGVLAKVAIVARKIFPTRRFMRHWFPRAALGPGWMAAGYLWRPVWLLLESRWAVVAWRRARSGSGS